MNRIRRTRRPLSVLLGVGVFLATAAGPAWAQLGGMVGGRQFDLAESVQLDRVDNAVLVQFERTSALLANRQWDEAVEILRQLAESSEGKLLAVANRRYVSLRAYCQLRLAALPPEALKLYRARVDPVAQKWYEQGISARDPRLLQNVVEQLFASSFGDDALLALGEMALESGDYAAARWDWERVVPSQNPSPLPSVWPGYPDTELELAAVRARLVLVSILEGKAGRARAELAEFVRLHSDARGRLGGREGKYSELLKLLLVESADWVAERSDPDWPTFAGNPQRNRTSPPLVDIGAVAWRVPLRPATPPSDSPPGPRTTGEDPREPLSFYPLLVGDLVLANNSQQILAVHRESGRPAWGQAAIYQEHPAVAATDSVPSDALGSPRFTMTVVGNRLFARMGSPVTGQPQNVATALRPGHLVCLDLAAEGRLLWKVEPEEGWALEGSPVADARGVYVAMRRQDIRPQAFVACFDVESGRLRWRRFICGAETPARDARCECTHNLLTLSGGGLYYNTNLGAVAAIAADDGRLLWVSLYPRARHGDLAKLAPHWRRELNPCLFDRGTLLVAPADSPRIFSFDAATGQMLWQTGSEVEDAVDLLGAAGDWLIAGGRKLYWISLKEEDRGRVKHVWPKGPEGPGYGRGLLAGQSVLWPTRDKLYVFDRLSARPLKAFDLAAHGIAGGNLLTADSRLLIATERELIAVGPSGGKMHRGNELKTEN